MCYTLDIGQIYHVNDKNLSIYVIYFCLNLIPFWYNDLSPFLNQIKTKKGHMTHIDLCFNFIERVTAVSNAYN